MSDTKSKKSRRLNIAIAVFFALSIATAIYYRLSASDSGGGSEVEWQCLPNPDRTVTCVYDVTEGAGSLCFDLVLSCDDGEHKANVCSGVVKAGAEATVRVDTIEPPIGPTIRCDKPRYENAKTKVEEPD